MKPRIYTASKVHRAPMWRDLRDRYKHMFDFTSSWIDMDPLDDLSIEKCRTGWHGNITDVKNSKYLLCYAEKDDPLSGTLVEIGAMLSNGGLVVLVGDHDWKTWQHHYNVVVTSHNLEAALLYILSHHQDNIK